MSVENPALSEPGPARKYRSQEEGAMRVIVAQHLRQRWPGARIIHEFPLRYSSRSIDMAAILPSEIIGVEIKSSRDTMDRLENQIRAFSPICSRLIIALAPKWNEELPLEERATKTGRVWHNRYTEAQEIIRRVTDIHCETFTVCHETGDMKNTSGGWHCNTFPWPARMLDLLHVRELAQIMGASDRSTHSYLVRACHDRLTGPQIIRAVCASLRARAAFAAESDPAIPLDQAAIRSGLMGAVRVTAPRSLDGVQGCRGSTGGLDGKARGWG
jgi:hypothetical protein